MASAEDIAKFSRIDKLPDDFEQWLDAIYAHKFRNPAHFKAAVLLVYPSAENAETLNRLMGDNKTPVIVPDAYEEVMGEFVKLCR